VRILAVDPGLTRCGVGVVDLAQGRRVTFVDVFVVQTPPSAPLSERLFSLHTAIDEAIVRHEPMRIALERVFAQHNLRTVMGTAQASGVVLSLAGARSLPVSLHTPSEVKAAVSGNGRANKAQVATAVRQILKLDDSLLLPDATDALALAVCSAWREGAGPGAGTGAAKVGPGATPDAGLTPAQQLWRDAERRTPRPRRPA
jgi:crossover junction endodeoxyribonuclease RuvC